jgi:hypothetical protein
VHDRRRAAVLHDVGDLRALQPRAHRNRDRTQAQDRQQGGHELDAVAEQHRHAIAGRDTALREPASRACDVLVQLRVGPAHVAGHQRQRLRPRRGGTLEGLVGPRRAVGEARHHAVAEVPLVANDHVRTVVPGHRDVSALVVCDADSPRVCIESARHSVTQTTGAGRGFNPKVVVHTGSRIRAAVG